MYAQSLSSKTASLSDRPSPCVELIKGDSRISAYERNAKDGPLCYEVLTTTNQSRARRAH